MKTVIFDAFPKQETFISAVLSRKYGVLIYGGAMRGGKTYVALATLLLLCKLFPGSRWAVIRKNSLRLKKNVRPSFNKLTKEIPLKIHETLQTFEFENGSKILFLPENLEKDPTLEAFRGLEINGAVLEEMSELSETLFNILQTRIGSHLIVPEPKNGKPPGVIIGTCNPTQKEWVKLIHDQWVKGLLPAHIYYLQSRIYDNPFFANDKEFMDKTKTWSIYEREVFIEGNWDFVIKTPNAFWHSFSMEHIKPLYYQDTTTIHVSIDSNSAPYCSASFWQVLPGQKEVFQFHEIAAADPYNHAGGLAVLTSEYLKEIEYNDIVYVYGDATTKNQNTIDPLKRSFFDLFIEEMQDNFETVDYIQRSNPSVTKTAAFVNALYEFYGGWSVHIGELCKKSISCYMTVTKDMDGTMKKKKELDSLGNTFEPYGHFSDCKRYFLFVCLGEVYSAWNDRFSESHAPIAIPQEDLF